MGSSSFKFSVQAISIAHFGKRYKLKKASIREGESFRQGSLPRPLLFYMHGFGVDLGHAGVVEMLVEAGGQAGSGGFAADTLVIAHQRSGADGDVGGHEHAQPPGQHGAEPLGEGLDHVGDGRVQHL